MDFEDFQNEILALSFPDNVWEFYEPQRNFLATAWDDEFRISYHPEDGWGISLDLPAVASGKDLKGSLDMLEKYLAKILSAVEEMNKRAGKTSPPVTFSTSCQVIPFPQKER